MRAFLLATATSVFCQPILCCSCTIQRETGSLRLGAAATVERAPLDQERSKIVVAAPGDAAQHGLAAAGVLARHDLQPGGELVRAAKLAKVTHAGGQCAGANRADAVDARRLPGLFVGPGRPRSRLVASPGAAMSSLIDEISRKARALPPEERIRLAEELLSSVQDSDEEIEAAWAEEIKRRLEEVENGTAKLIPAEEVFAEIRRLLK